MTLRPTLAALATLGVMALAIHDTVALPQKYGGKLDGTAAPKPTTLGEPPKWLNLPEELVRQARMTSVRVKDTPPFPNASRQIVPPPEYDRPYVGRLTLTRVATEQEVATRCGIKTAWPYKLGCNTPSLPRTKDGFASCHIIMVADKVIITSGFTPELIRRHEEAHCNGWPGDHKGARFAP